MNHSLLDQRLAALRATPGLPAAHVEQLGTLLRSADDWDCFRINPLAFGEARGLTAREAIDLFLHATRAGLLKLRFNLICPGCGSVEHQLARMDLAIRVVNRSASPMGFFVMRVDSQGMIGRLAQQDPNQFRAFLTARTLLNSQTFRDLFRVQTLDVNMRLRLRSLTLLFTDLKGSTELYDRTGDIRAYTFVREHFKVLSEAVKRHNGALIKTMGDAIMASFNEPTDAAQASLEMMRGMGHSTQSLKAQGHDTGLKVGLHEGPALAVTSDKRLDYFGQTVNVAARVQGLAQAGEIWLTPSVMDSPGVQGALKTGGWTGEEHQVALKGVCGNTRVFRMHR